MQKRRERINERLRILQNLVPNGTKVNKFLLSISYANFIGVVPRVLISCMVVYTQVDISTMLEEAVNYVKFLQLQIKVLYI